MTKPNVQIVTTRVYRQSLRRDCEVCSNPADRKMEVQINRKPFEPYMLCDSAECLRLLAIATGASAPVESKP